MIRAFRAYAVMRDADPTRNIHATDISASSFSQLNSHHTSQQNRLDLAPGLALCPPTFLGVVLENLMASYGFISCALCVYGPTCCIAWVWLRQFEILRSKASSNMVMSTPVLRAFCVLLLQLNALGLFLSVLSHKVFVRSARDKRHVDDRSTRTAVFQATGMAVRLLTLWSCLHGCQ